MAVCHILFGDKRGDTEAQRRVRFLLYHLTLQTLHSLFHHLQIKIEPHRSDMSRLLLAEQITRPADFQVGCGNAEA